MNKIRAALHSSCVLGSQRVFLGSCGWSRAPSKSKGHFEGEPWRFNPAWRNCGVLCVQLDAVLRQGGTRAAAAHLSVGTRGSLSGWAASRSRDPAGRRRGAAADEIKKGRCSKFERLVEEEGAFLCGVLSWTTFCCASAAWVPAAHAPVALNRVFSVMWQECGRNSKFLRWTQVFPLRLWSDWTWKQLWAPWRFWSIHPTCQIMELQTLRTKLHLDRTSGLYSNASWYEVLESVFVFILCCTTVHPYVSFHPWKKLPSLSATDYVIGTCFLWVGWLKP